MLGGCTAVTPEFGTSRGTLTRPDRRSGEFGKEDSNLHAPASKAGGLPLAHSRERHARVELACPVWKTGASAARPVTRIECSRGGRIRTGALLIPSQADSQAFPRPDRVPHRG